MLAPALAAPGMKSGFVTTSDGVRLHYLESGSGPAILFEPGWTMPADIWDPQIRYFAEHHRVVALDPRSQGESDKTTEGHYSARRAQDIKEVVDQLHLSPAVLVGWSLGVSEVLTYVDRFGTSTVSGVVLVDGGLGGDPNLQSILGGWDNLKRLQADRKQYTATFVRSMYKKPHPEEYYQKVTEASLRTPTNTAVVLLGNLYTGGDWRGMLGKLDKPVLYAITARMQKQGETLKDKVPSAKVEIFEDAGHALFVDDADRFNQVLDRFLK
jgi:microsomal epoxide hydrolase